MRYRPGQSWAAKGGLTTLVAYDPAEPADDRGRRPSDVCVGMLADPELAGRVADALNADYSTPSVSSATIASTVHTPRAPGSPAR